MKVITNILLSLMLIASPVNNKVANVTNGTGNSSYAHSAQINYEYIYGDGPSVTYGASAGVTYETNTVLIHCIEINVILRDIVESAQMTITLTTPSDSDLDIGYVSENTYVVITSNKTITLNIHNTNVANVKLYFSSQMLYELYGYVAVTDGLANSQKWLNSGYDYVHIVSSRLNSYYPKEATDYTSYVDGVEGYLSGIDTNIEEVQTQINTMLSNLTSLQTLASKSEVFEKWYMGIQDSFNNVFPLGWGDITDKVSFTRSQVSNQLTQGQYLQLASVSSNDNYKMVFNMTNDSGNSDLYYVDIPTTPYASNTPADKDVYIYDLDDNRILNLKAIFNKIDGILSFALKCYALDLTSAVISELPVSDIVHNLFVTSEDISLNEMQFTENKKLSQMLSILQEIKLPDSYDSTNDNALKIYIQQLESNYQQIIQNDLISPNDVSNEFWIKYHYLLSPVETVISDLDGDVKTFIYLPIFLALVLLVLGA